MKETNDKVYYLEYISIIFLVFSFIVLISVVLNNKKNNKSYVSIQPIVKEKNANTIYNSKNQEGNIDKSDKYIEHLLILKRLGFNIIGLNLNSAVASVYVDKNVNAYNKMKNFYSKCVIIDLNEKYQIFIDNLLDNMFEQKKSIQTNYVCNTNIQGKYEVKYVIINEDHTWIAKINDKIYTKNSIFDSGFRIIEVTNMAILIESDNGQIYKIIL